MPGKKPAWNHVANMTTLHYIPYTVGISKPNTFSLSWKFRAQIWIRIQTNQTTFVAFLSPSIQMTGSNLVLGHNNFHMPITVAARSKEWTVFVRLNAGPVDSNSIQGMNVYVRLFCIYVVLCVGRGLTTDWSPVQGVLPTVYRTKKVKKRPRSKRL
jgi:hypothetical protein